MMVEQKGAYLKMNSLTVYITSPKPPTKIFEGCDWIGDESIDQLTRRITEIKHFSTPFAQLDNEVD